jgi:hypothetical protein
MGKVQAAYIGSGTVGMGHRSFNGQNGPSGWAT